MSVVSFDGHDGFPERGFAEALLCGEEAPIRSHGKSFLGSEKKEGCLFRGGSSFCIYQGRHKLSESPASSGQIPTCMTWLRVSSSQC